MFGSPNARMDSMRRPIDSPLLLTPRKNPTPGSPSDDDFFNQPRPLPSIYSSTPDAPPLHSFCTPAKDAPLPMRQVFSARPPHSHVPNGVKRKGVPATASHTPLRPRSSFAPLPIQTQPRPYVHAHVDDGGSPVPSAFSSNRLAHMPPPRFANRTPQTKAETDWFIKRHTESMTRLRLCDRDSEDSGDDEPLLSSFNPRARAETQPHVSQEDAGHALFLDNSVRIPKRNSVSAGKFHDLKLQAALAKSPDEVAEAISPDGHITKRRAKSRPVSQELLEDPLFGSPPSRDDTDTPLAHAKGNAIAFPVASARPSRSRKGSNTSNTSSTGSPMARRRTSSARANSLSSMNNKAQRPVSPQASAPRAPLTRLSSSATLFFGPAIPSASPTRLPESPFLGSSELNRSRTSIDPRTRSAQRHRPDISSRHSYGGMGLVPEPSPRNFSSGDGHVNIGDSDIEDEEDVFIEDEGGFIANTAFSFRRNEDTPSPRARVRDNVLQKKYKPRDSGIAMSDSDSDDDFDHMDTGTTAIPRRHSTIGFGTNLFNSESTISSAGMFSNSGSSTSVGSFTSDSDDLITPIFGPGHRSGWPSAVNPMVVGSLGADDSGFVDGDHHPSFHSFPASSAATAAEVDSFIFKTLTAGASSSASADMGGGKKPPGTPVKRIKTAIHRLDQRPWQSAVATKISHTLPGSPFAVPPPGMNTVANQKGKKMPRKSMPASFPFPTLSTTSDSEEDDLNSPSERKERMPKSSTGLGKYGGIGLGKPAPGGVDPKRWLMRRNSSSAWSSGSESSTTPTRRRVDARLTIPHWSPSTRTASGSSTSSATASALNSPTISRGAHLPLRGTPLKSMLDHQSAATTSSTTTTREYLAPPSAYNRHHHQNYNHRRHHTSALSPPPPPPEGRFEADFITVDEVGSGEFGKVLKVRYRTASPDTDQMYAVKKSKRFDGTRQRLRLREEVDVLHHLAQRGPHPNVLHYIDSWEQDEELYIQTELCDMGNFARFLWEYGRVYPRLDKARVWRVLAELSNGLAFIHACGVIHLDLKPANIFLTHEGRFKIGDFGMASLWPRPPPPQLPDGSHVNSTAFEREGDKNYLAPEVLQGRYGMAADVFSLGMTMLETAANIVVPDQGESWHRLRQEDFSQVVDLDDSPELFGLICGMMRADPERRLTAAEVSTYPVVARARAVMEQMIASAREVGASVFEVSALGQVPPHFLNDILGRDAMDLSL